MRTLARLLDGIATYKGDAMTEAAQIFGFDYGDMTELVTIDRDKKKLDKQTADMLRKAMRA